MIGAAVAGAWVLGLAAVASADSLQPPTVVSPETVPPKLHHKVQYLATADVWNSLAGRPQWSAFISTYVKYRKATYLVRAAGDDTSAAVLAAELTRSARSLFPSDGAPRGASYAIVGSQNMDYRGMFMDGEVGLLFSGTESLVPLVDLLFLEGTVTWLDDVQALDRLLPPPSELHRRLARLVKDGL